MKTSLPATTVATINKQQILIIENGEKRVAVKPICTALGIDYSAQLQRLKDDEILGSVMGTIPTTGSDGKTYEMQTIPFKYVFGWLFRIDSRNVKPEARETVLKYQVECYEALYRHFTEVDEYLKFRDVKSAEVYEQVEAAREDFKEARNRLEGLKKQFAEIRSVTFDDWRRMNAQQEIEFPDADTTEEGGSDE